MRVVPIEIETPKWKVIMTKHAFQDKIGKNHCWGCGNLNEHGLQIKSYWDGDGSVCTWQPAAHHMAGPKHILNGGIIATIIDCHCVCTAIAAAYKSEDREIDSEPPIWYATVALNVKYLRATPIDKPVVLRAKITERTEKKTILTCSLLSDGKECAMGEVVAVRVPFTWRED